MKNDMNLIMENWRKNIDNNSNNDIENDIILIKESFRDTLRQIFSKEEITTVGDLRTFVKASKIKKGGGKILSTFGDLMPGVGKAFKLFKRAKGAKQAFKALSGAGSPDDGVATNTGMDRLRIDKNYSKIVDDEIEEGFLLDFLGQIEDLPDDAPIPDANEKLEDYLRFKFNLRTVDVAQGNDKNEK
ncbi:MAG TPA: hypothetical protein DCM40_44885 [Maribacter sp.]|nr:hypothetical protein [Maribacter sp.]